MNRTSSTVFRNATKKMLDIFNSQLSVFLCVCLSVYRSSKADGPTSIRFVFISKASFPSVVLKYVQLTSVQQC